MIKARQGILLTGATGLLGRYLLRDLLLAGERVTVLARQRRGKSAAERVTELVDLWSDAAGHPLPRPTVVGGDVRAPQLGLTAADRQQVASHCRRVLHAAACVAFRPSLDGEPGATNVDGTRQLLDLCERLGVPDFHYISTAFVCGETSQIVLESATDPQRRFHNDYEKSKWQAEQLVRGAGLNSTIYRPSVIVGDSRTGFTSSYHGIYRFIESAARLAEPTSEGRRRLPLRLPLTGSERRNLVPVDWVAQAIVRLMREPAAHGRTFHLVSGQPVAARLIKEVSEEVLQVDGVTFAGPQVFTDASPLERVFLDHLQEYSPYLEGDPVFDTSTLSAVLPDLPSAAVDRPLLQRLIEFAVADQWGRARRERKRPPAASERIDCRRYVEDTFPRAARRSTLARDVGLNVEVALDIVGPGGGQWTCGWIAGELAFVRRGLQASAEVLYRTDAGTFDDVVAGRQSPQDAFFTRRVAVVGDVEKALKLAVLFEHFLKKRQEATHADARSA
jgi:thioester reductase-like protein